MFTDKEIKSAKEVRDQITNGDVDELKSIYMAGEIVMWDESHPALEGKDRPQIKDYFPEGTTVEAAHVAYVNNKELYNYINALDNYIDSLEGKEKCIAFLHFAVEDGLSGNVTINVNELWDKNRDLAFIIGVVVVSLRNLNLQLTRKPTKEGT